MVRYKNIQIKLPMNNQTIILPSETSSAAEERSESSPFTVEFFMVQGLGFRCMAYCGEDGKWRSAFGNNRLFGPVFILE